MKPFFFSFVLTCVSLSFIACESEVYEVITPQGPADNELLDGAVEGLNVAGQIQFLKGDIAFNDDVFTIEEGLGPVFVSNRCASCHPGDGKGHPFNRLIRFNPIPGNPPIYGDDLNQLQTKAIPGYEPEQLPEGAPHTILIAPAITGLGFLNAVSDADILALADPQDANGDGISGRAHYNVPPDYVEIRPNSIPRGDEYIFRFGKKAGAYNLLHQTVLAYNQDMGIVSSYNPTEPYNGVENDPQVSNQTINNVVFYLKTLKAPIPRNQNDPDVIAGKQLFNQIQCAACHSPTLYTGPSQIEALAYNEFHPYTDLLLHDMGPGLDDGVSEKNANSFEWRTPPLWGIGLSKKSQGGIFFLLHDGRANSIREAILLHGGEAENSKNMYKNLSAEEQEKLISFIKSL